MTLGEILKKAVNPSDFWKELLDVIAVRYHLDQCIALQVTHGELRLFGESEGSRLRSAPQGVRKAILNGSSQDFKDGDSSWWIEPVEVAGLNQTLLIVTARKAPLEQGEKLQIIDFLEAAVCAYTSERKAETCERSLGEISKVVDLGLIIGESAHFGEAASRLCNELETELKAMRVSLGWRKKGLIELIATNHGGKVRNDTEVVGALCRAMDEAVEQDCEVGSPPIEGAEVNRQHRVFSESHGNCCIVTFPLRSRDGVNGALSVEYAQEFGGLRQEQVDALRVVLDLVSPQLVTLYEKSGWFGSRFWRAIRARFASILGYRHTGWKLAGLSFLLALGACCLIPITHKVKAPFVLRTQASADLTAPFAGYIDTVLVDVGEVVEKGQLLATLDRRELVMQQTELEAERDRNLSDARRYEAEGDLSQMKLSQLAVEQADTKLAVIAYRLARTELRAPFAGVIVEGDLKERLSSPTQVGEVLIRVVEISGTYGELQIDERDIHFMNRGATGEMSFTSHPEERFNVSLDQYEPVAVIKETGTYFRVRVNVTEQPKSWWRPGMSGVCKMDIGKRSVAWVYLHRTWEFIRLKLWF